MSSGATIVGRPARLESHQCPILQPSVVQKVRRPCWLLACAPSSSSPRSRSRYRIAGWCMPTTRASTSSKGRPRAYGLGEYKEAAENFERAYKLHPDPALLYNAAQAPPSGRRQGTRAHPLRELSRHVYMASGIVARMKCRDTSTSSKRRPRATKAPARRLRPPTHRCNASRAAADAGRCRRLPRRPAPHRRSFFAATAFSPRRPRPVRRRCPCWWLSRRPTTRMTDQRPTESGLGWWSVAPSSSRPPRRFSSRTVGARRTQHRASEA